MIIKSFYKNRKNIGLGVVILFSFFFLSACSISTNSSSNKGIDSSVFLSLDGGNSWNEATRQADTSSTKSIKDLNVNNMTFDPQDNMAVYLGSRKNGLYYTYNVGRYGWIKAEDLPNGLVEDVEVDSKDKCTVYVAISNRLYKTEDCNRSFRQVYFDNNLEVSVKAVAVDHYNPNNVYIGTSRGEIIKSMDAGLTWRTIYRLDDGISDIIISPLDSRLAFVGTMRNRIYSFNVGSNGPTQNQEEIERNFAVSNWQDLNVVLKDYNLGRTFRDFVVSGDGLMFIATNQALLRSPDNGITWEKLSIIQPEKEAIINALAVDKQNSDNIYYVTNTTFFRSSDGGKTWATKSLPTSRAGSTLLVDHRNPNVLYLGTVNLK